MKTPFSFPRRLATLIAISVLPVCIVRVDAQTVFGWGNNQQGQVGDGSKLNANAPVRVSGVAGIKAVSGGSAHTLALKSDGTVWAWGSNAFGQLGNGTQIDSPAPVQARGLTSVSAIAAGTGNSLAVKSDGTLWGWGLNDNGELGTGGARVVPQQVAGLTGVVSVASSHGHTVALKSDGTVWCLGDNTNGELGNGTKTPSVTPVRAGMLTGIKAVAAGSGYSLALGSDGTIWGWGQNASGEIGASAPAAGAVVPMVAARIPGALSVAAGGNHSLAVGPDGSLWAWGNNTLGQLGTGTMSSNPNRVPARVAGLTGVTAAAAGASHSVALDSHGGVWAWGWNTYGQLGRGNNDSSSIPVPVSGIADVLSVAAGDSHTIAIQQTAEMGPPSITAVVNAASFLPGISAASWVAVYGNNFSPVSRMWRAGEIVDGILPTEVEGVSVTIDGQPVAVEYVSPTQLNVQAPTTNALGTVQVQVKTAQGSASATADMRQFSPAFFTFDGKYAAAQHLNYIAVANINQFGNVLSSPAQPGEVVILYGTGFGPTAPAVPAGRVIAGPATVINPVTVRIGFMDAQVLWAGMVSSGLWQVNVKVPSDAPDGDAVVTAEVGGAVTQTNVYIPIKRL